MRIQYRITATNRGDRAEDRVNAVQYGRRIGQRLVIAKGIYIPSGCGFGGQFFWGAGGATDLPASLGQHMAKGPAYKANAKDKNDWWFCHLVLSVLFIFFDII
jgi:hypothetical protein